MKKQAKETREQELRRLILEQSADRANDRLRMAASKGQRKTRRGWRTVAK